MKILYVNPASLLGGAELSLIDLISSTRVAIPEAELHLALTAPGPLANRAENLGVRVHILPLPTSLSSLGDSALRGRGKIAAFLSLGSGAFTASLAARRYARDLHALIQDVRPSLIHSNGIKSHLLLSLATPRGVPVVWHIRDFLGSRPVVARALRWAAARGVAGAIAISQAVARDTRQILGTKLPIEVVYDGIDIDRFAPGAGDGTRLDGLAGLPSSEAGTFHVGLVATYARWKGHNVFLDAMARLDPRVGSQVRGYIIGGPIYQTKGSQFSESELRARIAALGLVNRVALIPFQSNTTDIYRALDVVVHASTLPEPFGRTIVESMACGRPTIVSQAGGAAELFTKDHDALGVSPGDPTALAMAIRRLIDDPQLRQAITVGARRSAIERFDRSRLGEEIIRVYERFVRISNKFDQEN